MAEQRPLTQTSPVPLHHLPPAAPDQKASSPGEACAGVAMIICAFVADLGFTAGFECWMGRSLFGPDGKPGLWEGNIWSSECSQRLADAYSFTHIGHGLVFFGLLWLFARRVPIRFRFLIAMLVEAGWEMLENSPIIINRYREATMALGYSGDSILNSLSDILMVCIGFFLAWRLPLWASALLFVAMEVGCALWVRDNLTLNVIMLVHPVEVLKAWQMGAHP